MGVIICPGVHSPELTQGFLAGLGKPFDPSTMCVFPAERFPAYSAPHILKFLGERFLGEQFLGEQWLNQDGQLRAASQKPLVLIGFSAGVVGAIGTAQVLQSLGVQVKALVAIDGWGVPLWGDFPIHRLSHDRFTHFTSRLLDQSHWDQNHWDQNHWSEHHTSFYADPDVAHLDLWRSPQTALGWSTEGSGQKQYPVTAAQFLQKLLIQYGELETT
jgi:hypothetical protein